MIVYLLSGLLYISYYYNNYMTYNYPYIITDNYYYNNYTTLIIKFIKLIK